MAPCITYAPLRTDVNSNTNIPNDRLVFTNSNIVSGFGAKDDNFAERTKLIQATIRTIINVTKCLLSKTIPYVVLKISSKAIRLEAIEIPVRISTMMLNQAKMMKRFNTVVPSIGRWFWSITVIEGRSTSKLKAIPPIHITVAR